MSLVVANDIILKRPKGGELQDISYYIEKITPLYPNYIIAEEYTEDAGKHYHLVIWTDKTKQTIKNRLEKVMPKNELKIRTTSEEVGDEIRLIAYTIKDGNYQVIGQVDMNKLEEAMKITFPKHQAKGQPFALYKHQLEKKYIDGTMSLEEVHEEYMRYNLDETDQAIQEQQKGYWFKRIMLKKDEELRNAYNIYSIKSLSQWKTEILSVTKPKKYCQGVNRDGSPCKNIADRPSEDEPDQYCMIHFNKINGI